MKGRLLHRLAVLLIALLLSATFSSPVLAQTAVYYAEDLAHDPKGIAVSPGYLTILEFYQEVDQVASGRPGLMKVEVNGSKIYVSTLVNTGSTDLVVEVGARTHLFRVSITKGNAPRRYVIVLQKPAKPAAPPAASPPPAKPAAPRPAAPTPVTAPAKPAPAKPAAPRPAASSGTVASGAVAGLSDPSVRVGAAPPTANTNSSVTRFVYADFERLQGVQPTSNLGGTTALYSFEQNASARTVLTDARSGGPALLLDAEGRLSQRAYFDYETKSPNQWAGANLTVNALPMQGGKKQPLDISGYDTVALDLAVTDSATLKLELKSHDNGLQTGEGDYPQYELAVGSALRTYRVALSKFRVPDSAKTKLAVADVLRRFTELSVNVTVAGAAKGRVTVDNIVFERNNVGATQKPAASGSATPSAVNTTAARPQAAPAAQSASGAQAPVVNSASLEFSVLRRVVGTTPGQVAIYYTLKNLGTQRLTLTADRLELRQGGKNLTAGLRLDTARFSLRPGEAHLGTIIVQNAVPGDLSLRWTATDSLSGRAYLIERSIHVESLSAGTARP